MKFYDCSTAPSPRRVRMFIAEKGLDIPVVQVDLRSGEHLGEAFRAINPHCTVPVLELDDGTKLLDSNSISLYLDETFPEPNLMGRDPKEKAVIAGWNRTAEWDGLAAGAEALRNHAKGMKGRAITGPVNYEQIPELAERGRKRAVHFLEELDRRFADSEFLAGNRFTIADITAVIAVDFYKWIKVEPSEEQTSLKRWYGQVSSRPGYVD